MGNPDEGSDEEVANESDDDDAKEALASGSKGKGSRREKSLGVLSQKFVRLFLNAENGVVSLETAARRLMEGDVNDDGQLKTKIRRLYDIANILTSLGLIEKTHTADGSRKPAFKWTYPTGDDAKGVALPALARVGGPPPGSGSQGDVTLVAAPAKRAKKAPLAAGGAPHGGAAAAAEALIGGMQQAGGLQASMAQMAHAHAILLGQLTMMSGGSQSTPEQQQLHSSLQNQLQALANFMTAQMASTGQQLAGLMPPQQQAALAQNMAQAAAAAMKAQAKPAPKAHEPPTGGVKDASPSDEAKSAKVEEGSGGRTGKAGKPPKSAAAGATSTAQELVALLTAGMTTPGGQSAAQVIAEAVPAGQGAAAGMKMPFVAGGAGRRQEVAAAVKSEGSGKGQAADKEEKGKGGGREKGDKGKGEGEEKGDKGKGEGGDKGGKSNGEGGGKGDKSKGDGGENGESSKGGGGVKGDKDKDKGGGKGEEKSKGAGEGLP